MVRPRPTDDEEVEEEEAREEKGRFHQPIHRPGMLHRGVEALGVCDATMTTFNTTRAVIGCTSARGARHRRSTYHQRRLGDGYPSTSPTTSNDPTPIR